MNTIAAASTSVRETPAQPLALVPPVCFATADAPARDDLLDLVEAIVSLPHAVALTAVLAVELDACDYCPPIGPVDPAAAVCFVAYQPAGSLWTYRDACCAACLDAAIREHDTNGTRVWIELPTQTEVSA